MPIIGFSGVLMSSSVGREGPEAVPVGKFGEHVQHMHADNDKLFEKEFNVRVLGKELLYQTE